MVLGLAGAGVNYAAVQAPLEEDPPLRLVLNVPANRIYVYEHGERTKSYRVSVGQRRFATPAGSYTLSTATWNPWWHPPKSEWARAEKPEPPGWDNPMGRVKLNFTELYYVHGTPKINEDALGIPASHGCVRMANRDVIELAQLVHRYATPDLASSEVQELVDNPQDTRTIRFRNEIPFAVVYDVAIVRNDFLIIYPDVYARLGDKAAMIDQVQEVLANHGVDPSEINRGHLDRLVEKGMKMRVAMSLEELTTMRTATVGSDTERDTQNRVAYGSDPDRRGQPGSAADPRSSAER
ncbi:MAG: L,D-transpeptidase [Longimicrobiales bacterium]